MRTNRFLFALNLVGCAVISLPAVAAETITEGSTPTHRSLTDTFSGQVNIYVGGAFPAATHMVALQFLFDVTTASNTTGYITPLLLEFKPQEAFTVYTVVAIGRGFEVKLSSVPQTIPFEVIDGVKVTTSGISHLGLLRHW